jgi:hypothetical protein
MRDGWKFWVSMIVVVLSMVLCSTVYGQDVLVEKSILQGWYNEEAVDIQASMIEFRIGKEVKPVEGTESVWDVGLLGTYFVDDASDPSRDWGLGLFAKLAIDPNATIPLSNWLPKLGDWIGLPETISAKTYLIGKGLALPYDGGVDLMLSVGPGAKVGPVCIEYVYGLVEGGDADNPALTSGPTLWFGLEPIRF